MTSNKQDTERQTPHIFNRMLKPKQLTLKMQSCINIAKRKGRGEEKYKGK